MRAFFIKIIMFKLINIRFVKNLKTAKTKLYAIALFLFQWQQNAKQE